MAESAVIGILRALLTLDSAEYETGIKRITKDTKVAETTFGDLGGVVASVGKIMGGVFTAQAILGFGKQIVTFADQIGDLSDQTGISTTRLQALNYVMAGSGVTVETLASGIGMLSKALVGGDTGAIAAIRALGLDLDAIMKMNPDDIFIEIAEAIQRIPDAKERIAIFRELFGGKSGEQFLKVATKDLRAFVEQTEKTGPIIDEQLIKRAGEFEAAWERGKLRFQAFGADVIRIAADIGSAIAEGMSADQGTHEIAGIAAAKAFIGPMPNAIKAVGEASVKTAEQVKQVGTSSLQAAKDAIALEEATKKAAEQGVKKLEEQAAKTAAALKEKLAREAEAAAQAYARLMSEIANEEGLARMKADAEAIRIAFENGTIALEQFGQSTVLLLRNQSDLTAGLIYSTEALDEQAASVGLGAQAMMDAHAQSVEWRVAMDDLAQSFFQFASIAGDSLGKVVRQIGAGISAIGLAESAVGSLKQGFSALGSGSILKGLTGIVGGIGGIASAASAAIQLVMSLISGLRNLFGGGWEGTVGNPKRDQFIAQYGGDQAMGQKILEALMTGGLDYTAAESRRQQLMDAGLYAADSESEMRSAMSAIADLIGGQVTLHSGGEVTARLKVGERVLSQDQNEWFTGLMDRLPTTDVLARVASDRGAQAAQAAPSADRRLEDLVERRLPKLVGRAVADALTLAPRLRTS